MGSRRTSGGTRELWFKEHRPYKGKKLPTYEVHNAQYAEEIGFIHWRGGWRQFVFQAYPEVDMSRSCHKEIDKFIDKLMEEWRKKKREEKEGK